MKYTLQFSQNATEKIYTNVHAALEAAENHLLHVGDTQDMNVDFFIKWRRDELHPDNFIFYKKNLLVKHLEKNGEVILQLLGIRNKKDKFLDHSVKITSEKIDKNEAE